MWVLAAWLTQTFSAFAWAQSAHQQVPVLAAPAGISDLRGATASATKPTVVRHLYDDPAFTATLVTYQVGG